MSDVSFILVITMSCRPEYTRKSTNALTCMPSSNNERTIKLSNTERRNLLKINSALTSFFYFKVLAMYVSSGGTYNERICWEENGNFSLNNPFSKPLE